MCGIAGVLNSVYGHNSDRFIRDSMVAGMLRGIDSAGIMQTDYKGTIYTHREATDGLTFSYDKVTDQFLKDTAKSRSTVVHLRAATQGNVITENAHPFILKKDDGNSLVGVHNGSLTGWQHKKTAKQYVVDSKWALSMIAEHGIDAFKEITGPYCFVWADTAHKDKIYMARNDKRPMHLLFSENRKSMYFASESGMLSWLCERNDIRTENEILILTPGRVYEFDMSGGTVTYTHQATPVAPAYVAPPRQTTTGTASYVPTNMIPWRSDSSTSGLNTQGAKFIGDIKLAAKGKLLDQKDLAAALDKVNVPATAEDVARDKVIDDTLAAITDVEVDIVGQSDDDSGVDSYGVGVTEDLVPEGWFSQRSVKPAEKDLAVTMGFYRELQWFEGIGYDTDNREILGDVEIWDSKKGKTKYTGVIRNCSEARAHSEYIDNARKGMRSGYWAVVTGAYDDKQLGIVFVLSELNMVGKSMMEDQRKKAN